VDLTLITNKMKDTDKKQGQLIRELTQLRQRIAELETTGRKRNQFEESLRTERDRAQQYLDIAEVMLVVLDKKGTITRINRKGNQILGYTEGELIGKNWFTTCLPAYLQKDVRGVFKKLMVGKGKQTEFYENPVLTKSGTERIVAWHNTILKDTRGNIIGTLSSGQDITERKRGEDTLRETSLFLRSILDSSSSISIVFTDLEQNILFWNKGAENIFGYKAEEVVDRHTVDILYPDEGDTKQTVEEIRSYILNKKRGVHREIKEITKDGRILWISLTSTPRFDESGNVIGIVGIGEDITERKQIEEALRASEEQFRQFFENAPEYCYMISAEGLIFNVNNTVLGVLGYKKEELVGKPLQTIYAPESLQKMERLYSKWKKNGKLKDEEMVIITKKGDRRTVLLSAGTVRDSDGNIVHSISIQNDITERKNIEDALRESEEKYRELINGMNDTAWVIDFNGKFVDVNNAAVGVLGYSRKELLTMGPNDIDSSLNAENIIGLIKRMRTDKLQVFETTHTTKNGKTIPVEIKSSLVTYQGKQAILSIARDITERKRTQEALTLFRSLIDHINDAIEVIDPETGRFLDANEQACLALGYTREEFLTLTVPEINPVVAGRSWKETMEELRRSGFLIRESQHRRKDGSIIPVEINSNYIRLDRDYVLTVVRDITERKQAEKALRESAEQYRILTNTAMDGFLKLDLEGHILDVNKVYCDFIDYSKEELLKMTIGDIEAKETPDKVKKHLKKVTDVGSDRFESFLRRKDGRIIDVEISLTSLPQSGHILVFVRDITDRKQAEEELTRSYQQMQEMLDTAVNALASTVEMKDQYTAGHQPRVTQLACAIAEEMGFSKERIEGIRMAGLIHDIGKIMVPAEILNKPGPLTEIQYEMVKMHPRAGYEILKDIKFPWPVAQMVLQHHELMDGSGYPEGLAGEKIMVEARILTVANVIEAMVSHRPYRAAFNIKEALAEILKNKGTLYDPVVVDACRKIFTENRFAFDKLQ
jgi:PAS domain S-box-containing protein/putative nucleotidyltransferase with HDIG domain